MKQDTSLLALHDERRRKGDSAMGFNLNSIMKHITFSFA